MLRSVIVVGTVLSVLGGLLVWSPAAADQAPFWESPVGLTPGHPDSQVRMVAETVDIQVVERPAGVYAAVNASFDMLNRGPDIQMPVGFPDFHAGGQPYSPVEFAPARLEKFRVWTDHTEFQVSKQTVNAGQFRETVWFFWEMAYPSLQPVRVYVSYEQKLTGERDPIKGPWRLQPMYVLRTGALWDGTIEEATITMTALSGGGFVGGPEVFSGQTVDGTMDTIPIGDVVLGADAAAEVSDTRIVWRLHDFKPTRDIGTTYIVADAWRPLRAAEIAIDGGSASADDYLSGTQALLRMIGTQGPYAVPQSLVSRYPTRAREWAQKAVVLAPNSAGSWEAVGDTERWFAMPAHKNHGDLECWPAVGAAAYQRALEFGSATASAKLGDLVSLSDDRRSFLPDIETCTPGQEAPPVMLLVRRAVKAGNQAWADGVSKDGTAAEFPRYFADTWLRMLTDEVNALRQRGMYRSASLQELTFRSVTITAPDAAVVETTEDWYDKTYRADRSVARNADGRVHQRYELRLRDGMWKVVDATLMRETPPREY